LWKQNPRPSIFANDPLFKGTQSGKTASQISTDVVKRKRDEGVQMGTIYGLNKDRDQALLHARSFHVFSKAGTK
jgi:hypothetical protein